MRGKGGGPKTARGKAAASRNAIRHGILSEAPTVQDIEDPRDWQRHLDGITESFAPEGWHESLLANRIAALLWHLHRIQRYETRMIRVNLDDIPDSIAQVAVRKKRFHDIPFEETITMKEVEHRMDRWMIPDGFTLPTIMRYEAHIHRLYIQTLHELEATQARRRGEHAPSPASTSAPRPAHERTTSITRGQALSLPWLPGSSGGGGGGQSVFIRVNLWPKSGAGRRGVNLCSICVHLWPNPVVGHLRPSVPHLCHLWQNPGRGGGANPRSSAFIGAPSASSAANSAAGGPPATRPRTLRRPSSLMNPNAFSSIIFA